MAFYDHARKELDPYWDQPDGTKTQWRREHPREDANGWLVGYWPSVVSPTAKETAKAFAPNRQVVRGR